MAKQSYQLDTSRQWTATQRQGVLDRSGSVIVSAAAGTGKTSVLTERCVSLIAGPEGIDIDRLLVVTFTEAAALEMRTRIRNRLLCLYEDKPSGRLTRQVALLDAASICTLHSFCLRMIRENFSLAGIDPEAGVLDDDEAQLLKDDVLDRMLDGLYTSQETRGKQFVQFVATYGQGRDTGIRDHVKHIYEYLRSLPPRARDNWKRQAVEAYRVDSDGGLTSDQFKHLREAITEEIDILLDMSEHRVRAFQQHVGPHEGLDKALAVQEHVKQMRDELQKVNTASAVAAWKERAVVSPWSRMSRWGDVPEACRAWAKWLHDHWTGEFADRWLIGANAWTHGLQITAPCVDLVVWLVSQFGETYGQEKRRIGKIDYSDMEEYALGLLIADGSKDSASDIARAYQQRYDFVLVDEYQDINPIQAEILRLVSRESTKTEKPNLFTVGDVKQSIYGFRMTNPGEFLKRLKDIQDRHIAGAAISLQENFRSRPEVLEAVNHVFRKLMRADEAGVQYDSAAELKPGRKDYPAAVEPAVEMHILGTGKVGSSQEEPSEQTSDDPAEDAAEQLQDREKEAYLVAGRIQELVGRDFYDGEKVRKITYRDVVILLRSTQDTAEVYATVLRGCGIPVYAELRSGYFASQEVKDMLALLAVLENMQQDIPLAAVLRSPLLGEGLTDADLVDIRTARQYLDFHQAVRWYGESGSDELLRRKLAARIDMLDRWRDQARLQPLSELIASIYQETGILEYVTLLEDGPQCRANLESLYQRARQFGQFNRQGLRRFVSFINEMIRAGQEAHSPTAVSEAQDVVRIMSIHASKGLEFPVVFLADLGRKFNDMDFNGSVVLDREGLLGLEARDPHRMLKGDTLVKLLAARKVRCQNRAEELRVLYVAMTRAKDRLILVGTCKKDPVPWLEEQRQLWEGLPGQLPRYLLRHAISPLDWLTAALASSQGAFAAVTMHSPEETAAWQIAQCDTRLSGRQILAVLDGAGTKEATSPTAGAAAAIDRLTKAYRYQMLTSVPAITPVTELKGRLHWDADDTDDPQHAEPVSDGKGFGPSFAMPRRLRPITQGDAARRRGTATHLFLEKLDLSAPTDTKSLGRQLEHLVEARLLSPAEAAEIDMGGVAWLLNDTPLGNLFRQHHKDVRREMPFLMRLEPEILCPGGASDDLADSGIVRGVIDVLWCTPEGIEIADFKTDAVSGPELRRRIDLYKDQLRMYAEAIRRIWPMPVHRLWLAFLHARHIEPFTPAALRD